MDLVTSFTGSLTASGELRDLIDRTRRAMTLWRFDATEAAAAASN